MINKIVLGIIFSSFIILMGFVFYKFHPIKAADDNCQAIFKNGETSQKINIYFYEQGFNSNSQLYNDYVQTVIAATFGGFAHDINFTGIEPFKSLKNEFNVFSYTDLTNTDDYGFPTLGYHFYSTIKEKLTVL
ncbi:MAG: hypothetical protein NT116_04500 [Candidatus Parcubacteria bacterium]|nr:hypothetical protein [Candidatus Parcubacteria bacterium]